MTIIGSLTVGKQGKRHRIDRAFKSVEVEQWRHKLEV